SPSSGTTALDGYSSARAGAVTGSGAPPSEPKPCDSHCSFMAKTEELRRKAKACRRLAQRARDPGVKARYKIVADEWSAIADAAAPVDRPGRRQAHRRLRTT